MKNTQLQRRSFLKLLGTGAVAVPALSALPTLAAGSTTATAALATTSADTMTRAQMIESMRASLLPLFEGKEMALEFFRIASDGTEDFRIQINNHELYPVASVFKSFLALYYFVNTPRDEWQYQQGSRVYSVVVYSNNGQSGQLLAEMGRRVEGPGNAIEKFNDFLLNVMGLTNGMYSWNWPGTPTVGLGDERFLPTQERQIWIRTLSESISNVWTAADLAIGWEFISRFNESPYADDEHFREAIRITRELCAIPANDYRSPIEKVLNSGYIGKDGTLPLGDINVGRVINDAGIVRVPTGEYVISFMSAGENESSTSSRIAARCSAGSSPPNLR